MHSHQYPLSNESNATKNERCNKSSCLFLPRKSIHIRWNLFVDRLNNEIIDWTMFLYMGIGNVAADVLDSAANIVNALSGEEKQIEEQIIIIIIFNYKLMWSEGRIGRWYIAIVRFKWGASHHDIEHAARSHGYGCISFSAFDKRDRCITVHGFTVPISNMHPIKIRLTWHYHRI